MAKSIVRIQVPNASIRGKIKQANGNKYSYRVVLPASAGKYKSHVLLISEDFCIREEKKVTLNFYEDRELQLSRPHRTTNGMVYEKVILQPRELEKIMNGKMLENKELTKRYTDEQIEYLKANVGALDFMMDHVGLTFERQGRNYYRCEQHSSMVIDMNKNIIYWNSMGIKGSVVTYLMQVEKKSFIEAMAILEKYHKGLPEDKKMLRMPEYEQIAFELPVPKHSQYNVKKYLCEQRGIREELIRPYIDSGQIYEDEKGNVVFVSQNTKGESVGAFRRSTFSTFKGDVAGSNKYMGFYIESCPGAKKLVITEAYIDAFSYLSHKMNKGEKIDFNVLGCDSCNVMEETFRQNYFRREDLKKNLDTVILAADNDKGGLKAIEDFKEFIKPFHYIKNVETDVPKEFGYDWNKELCEQLSNGRIGEIRQKGREI